MMNILNCYHDFEIEQIVIAKLKDMLSANLVPTKDSKSGHYLPLNTKLIDALRVIICDYLTDEQAAEFAAETMLEEMDALSIIHNFPG